MMAGGERERGEGLPDEIRSDEFQRCPKCEWRGMNLIQHLAVEHPALRERYSARQVRIYTQDEGGTDD